MQPDRNRRSELGRFLRLHREQIAPAEVGLSLGPRRRRPGLRRSEVAILAGMSTSWYTFLEQGREILPSRAVLESLATVLRMNADERLHLFDLAYGQDGAPALAAPLEPAELLRQIVAMWDTSPYPVYGCNEYFDVVAWNPANSAWYCDWGALDEEHRNVLHWILTVPEARRRLVDWADVAEDVVARWRSHRARHPQDVTSAEHTERLLAASPEFADWWSRHKVLEHRTAVRRILHDELGMQSLRIVPMLSPELGSCGVVFHLPVPAP